MDKSMVVQNRALQGTGRKFLISSVIDVGRWDGYDEDSHTVGTYIAWDLQNTTVKVEERRAASSLEYIIPPENLLDYQKHFQDGCAVACSGLDACKFKDDKM